MTGEGPARAEIEQPAAGRPAFLLALTHGAGGGPRPPDVLAVAAAAAPLGAWTALVTQPYRVAGRRAPGPAARQDAAWVEVIAALRELAGARPGSAAGRPDRSRAAELAAAGTDVLVINGDRDPFGVPAGTAATRVIMLAGESHALSRHPQEAGRAAADWLREVLARPRG